MEAGPTRLGGSLSADLWPGVVAASAVAGSEPRDPDDDIEHDADLGANLLYHAFFIQTIFQMANEMKKFMAVVELKQGVSSAETARFAVKEAERFKELFYGEVIWEYHKKSDYPKFWCIVRATSLEEAQAQIRSLPYYDLGFLLIEIDELAEKNNYNR